MTCVFLVCTEFDKQKFIIETIEIIGVRIIA